MTFSGFSWHLQDPADLVDKLQHDLGRIWANPHDAYAAFDFFVTADHVEEWLANPNWKGHPKGHSNDLMRLVCHVGSSGKHQSATSTRHTTAKGVVERAGYFDHRVFDADAFDVGGIVIDHNGLDGSLPGSIDALDLAKRVLTYLRGQVNPGTP